MRESGDMVFAKRLKKIMSIRGENQVTLSAKTNMQRQTISLYMNGQSTPNVERLRALANALNVSADWLLGLSDKITADPAKRKVYEDEVYRKALDTYGAESQTLMVMEEMSELTKALCKHARGKPNRLEIAEEIADVQITLAQMIILYDCADEVEEYKRFKLERLRQRLNREVEQP